MSQPLRAIIIRGRNKLVSSPRLIQTAMLTALLGLALVLLNACGGSKANVRTDESNSAQPPTIDVTTAAAIVRELPQYFEATGSLTGDEQTDVAPSVAGKVVAIGVDMGSYVRRGQMIVRLDDVDAQLRVQQMQRRLSRAVCRRRGARHLTRPRARTISRRIPPQHRPNPTGRRRLSGPTYQLDAILRSARIKKLSYVLFFVTIRPASTVCVTASKARFSAGSRASE